MKQTTFKQYDTESRYLLSLALQILKLYNAAKYIYQYVHPKGIIKFTEKS